MRKFIAAEIIEFHKKNPDWSSLMIGDALGYSAGSVRSALSVNGHTLRRRPKKTSHDCGELSAVIERHSIPEPNSGCLLWLGAVNNKQYGKLMHRGKGWLAHRAAWTVKHGEIPAGLYLLHKCDVTYCINPDHMHVGDQWDNMKDMVDRNRACSGVKSKLAKLSDDAVRCIRSSKKTIKHLTEQFGVSASTIRSVRKHATWAHVR